MAGLENARAKGKRLGRPAPHDPNLILKLRAEGRTYGEIVKLTGAPRGTVCRVIAAGRKTSPPESTQPTKATVARGR
jgi:DNA invertase Pin-like site-specific DNA recombinase